MNTSDQPPLCGGGGQGGEQAGVPAAQGEVAWDADGLPPDCAPERPPWAPKTLSARHCVMCEYHLNGFTNREIAQVLDMHEVSIGLVLRSAAAQSYCTDRLADLNAQFHGQFAKVVETFNHAHASESIDVRLKAADMWLKAHSRYQPKREDAKSLTVEDVIARLLQAKTVQVNVNSTVNNSPEGGAPPPADDFSFLERVE